MMTEEEDDYASAREYDAARDRVGKLIQDCKVYEPSVESAVTIPSVPLELLEANKKYYMPTTLTIGPYHYRVSDSVESRAYDWKRELVKRYLQQLRPDVTTEALIDILFRSVPAVRVCYDVDVRSGNWNFVGLEIMVLDGCFIVELISFSWRNRDKVLCFSDLERIKHPDLVLDLLKFDNQLPFFFLESLYELTQHDPGTSFADCALFFFGREVFGFQMYEFGHIDLSSHSINHLLHLVMIAFFHSPPTTPRLSHRSLFPSFGRPASKLEPYGVKFMKRNSPFITDIVFRNGVLEIPAIVLDGSSASLFSNLLATEMHCEKTEERWVMSYVFFMDGLIKDVNDLKVLCRAGIFECRVSDPTRLVSLFRDLASANALVYSGGFLYSDQVRKMQDYCASVGPRLRAYLKQAFKDWDAFNGILLLILTVTQTLFSILGYSPSSGNNNNKKN